MGQVEVALKSKSTHTYKQMSSVTNVVVSGSKSGAILTILATVYSSILHCSIRPKSVK